jgi:hypothetical protein
MLDQLKAGTSLKLSDSEVQELLQYVKDQKAEKILNARKLEEDKARQEIL